MTVEDERRLLRAELRAKRQALGATERMTAATGVAASLEQLPEFLTDPRIAGYWAIDGELPLHSVVASLQRRGQRYYLPRLAGPRLLRFAPWHPGVAFEPNRYGIPEPACAEGDLVEPSALDVVLVPLLGFDRRGHRLGYGGGYYDTSFAFLRERTEVAQPVYVGIGYAAQELDVIEASPWDVALDYVATENELIDCRAGAA